MYCICKNCNLGSLLKLFFELHRIQPINLTQSSKTILFFENRGDFFKKEKDPSILRQVFEGKKGKTNYSAYRHKNPLYCGLSPRQQFETFTRPNPASSASFNYDQVLTTIPSIEHCSTA